jgi:hypothetical protein
VARGGWRMIRRLTGSVLFWIGVLIGIWFILSN